jgi:hypothetical protein
MIDCFQRLNSAQHVLMLRVPLMHLPLNRLAPIQSMSVCFLILDGRSIPFGPASNFVFGHDPWLLFDYTIPNANVKNPPPFKMP